METFCNAEKVIEIPQRGATWNRILNSDVEEGLLLLERAPTSKEHFLYLPPNDHVLERQQRAIERLREVPQAEHRSLLRLTEDPNRARWPNITRAHVEQWAFLTNPEIEGTDEQKRFVETAMGTPDFVVLEGPPGSGKTTAICELIVQEVRLGHRILLCASTHVAVDNVLESLQEHGITSSEVIAVRIGDQRLISEKVRDFQLQERAKKEKKDLIKKLSAITPRLESQEYLLQALQSSSESEESLISRIILQSANVVCGTTIGILQHPDIRGSRNNTKKSDNGNDDYTGAESDAPKFDCLILDEASKTTFQEFLVPALFAKRWILVGDVQQLSPYVEKENVEDNLKSLLTEEDAYLCYKLFKSWQSPPEGIVLVDSPDSSKYLTQVSALKLNVLDLSEPGSKLNPIEALGAHIILCNKADLQRVGRFIPPDMAIIPPLGTGETNRRHAYWAAHYSKDEEDLENIDKVTLWSRELSWRVTRSFEHRDDKSISKFEGEAIRNLLPFWFNQEKLDEIISYIETVKRVALPSVLELLQKGFGRYKDARGSCLTDGLSPSVLSSRFVSLSYQHRMHPDISRFPKRKNLQ